MDVRCLSTFFVVVRWFCRERRQILKCRVPRSENPRSVVTIKPLPVADHICSSPSGTEISRHFHLGFYSLRSFHPRLYYLSPPGTQRIARKWIQISVCN